MKKILKVLEIIVLIGLMVFIPLELTKIYKELTTIKAELIQYERDN